ncbi:hypothetical protein IMCC3317_27020 [Kordia antarctica]|uniref:Uncharacterized protein n=1 Tax=Kordia antarctica TaxID=1218801 RepID=A0A7L4ZKS9_9FLAO|nr:hypothetical protein [Kordia antarctica]QHI37323.1 hypothetical protein IMCC3317_27020 [Kordia antarctica]
MFKTISICISFLFFASANSQETVDPYKDQKANAKNFPSNLKKSDQLIWCIDAEKKKGKWVVILEISKEEIKELQEKLVLLGFISRIEKTQESILDINTMNAIICFEKEQGKIYECCGIIGISKGMKSRIEKAFQKRKRVQKKN